MSSEVAVLVNEAWPYVSAAVSGYGLAVLKKSEEAAADTTVGWGRRLLRRAFGTGDPPGALADLAEDPEDSDLQAAFRVAFRKVLESDPELAREVRSMLDQASTGISSRGVAGNSVAGSVISGDNIQIGWAGRDVNIRRR